MYRLGSEESYTRRSISRIHAALRRGSSARVVGDFAIGRACRLGTGEILPFLQPSVLARPPNALTLSCKSRPPCRPPGSGAAAAATNTGVAGANCSRRDAGAQFGAAQGGSAAEPGLGGFCQLVRAVSRLVAFGAVCARVMKQYRDSAENEATGTVKIPPPSRDDHGIANFECECRIENGFAVCRTSASCAIVTDSAAVIRATSSIACCA